MAGRDGGSRADDDPSRTSPLPVQPRARAGWADRSRWPWYLLTLAVLLLILVSCQLNRTAERADPRPIATVTVTASTAPSIASPVPSARTSERPSRNGYRRPAKPNEDQLFYRSTFRSCATLNIVYRHGVGTDGAVDQVTGDEEKVDDWTDDPSSYWVNEALDQDKDGVACERGSR